MSTFYIDKTLSEANVALQGEDFHHIKNVLRMKIGEETTICDKEGVRFRAKLLSYEENCANFEITHQIEESSELPVDITLFQGLPKQDRFELIVQKSTELRCF